MSDAACEPAFLFRACLSLYYPHPCRGGAITSRSMLCLQFSIPQQVMICTLWACVNDGCTFSTFTEELYVPWYAFYAPAILFLYDYICWVHVLRVQARSPTHVFFCSVAACHPPECMNVVQSLLCHSRVSVYHIIDMKNVLLTRCIPRMMNPT